MAASKKDSTQKMSKKLLLFYNCMQRFVLNVQFLKGTMSRENFSKLRLWGDRSSAKDMSDRIFTTLRCPYKLLLIIKDGAHRIETEFMLGPGSGVKFASDTASVCLLSLFGK